ELAVDPRADTTVTDLGVHRVREVDRGRAGRQRNHVALRREDVHLLAGQVEAQRVEELARIGRLTLPVEQLPQPSHLVDVRRRPRRSPGLPSPVPASPPRCRPPPCGPSPSYGSASPPACRSGRSPWCATTGTC